MIGKTISHYKILEKLGEGGMGESYRAEDTRLGRPVAIAIGVAYGLERAHERGIIHRDIKPANIMITRDGLVKVMDFGIAKLAGEAAITKTGSSMGTAAYMSPERARCGTVDFRTAIWSLGVLLYEMLTGQRLFGGDYDQAVIYSVINEDPKPPPALRREVPPEIERIVLPFEDISPGQDQDYFCEEIAEELINALVQIGGLRVAARTSSAQFKSKPMDVRAIGRELGVQSILEGSVRKAGDRLRITVQLINVDDGYNFFSEKYDRTAGDIFAIQDEISLAIVDRLKVKLLRGEKSKLVKRHTESEEAYRFNLQGRYFWNRRHEGGLQRGIECFQRAIAIDPEYALPYSGIADCYFDFGWYDFLAPVEAFGKCKEAALKALEMDPDLAEAQASIAVALQFFDWNWPAAETEFQRAIELNPKYAAVHHFYSLFLSGRGRSEEAIEEAKRAQELDPIQPVLRGALGFILYLSDRYDETIEYCRALMKFDPNFFTGWLLLGISCAEAGRFAEAEASLRKADELTGGSSTLILGIEGYALVLEGKRDESRTILERMLELGNSRYVSAQLTAASLVLGEQETAFEWFERALGERDHWLCYMKHMPMLRRMRTDPRFRDVLRRLHADTLREKG